MQPQDDNRHTGALVFASKRFTAWAAENEVPYKRLGGCTAGVKQSHFIILQKDVPAVFKAGMFKGEETVTMLTPQPALSGANRQALIIHLDETGLKVRDVTAGGEWRHVSREEAMATQNWIFDPDSARHFIAGAGPASEGGEITVLWRDCFCEDNGGFLSETMPFPSDRDNLTDRALVETAIRQRWMGDATRAEIPMEAVVAEAFRAGVTFFGALKGRVEWLEVKRCDNLPQ